ncbi:MAG: acetyltransferase [Desulfuromonadales bacterium C00003068]|jgi:amino-acid N-acetyltransferase|nr:N-acetyltransferase [Deltaproteobacteria bacterium]OEU72186.1 MAG: acetyltransferase [Desulfuromonadales bacterium C00003068]
MKLRKACIGDASAIHKLLVEHAGQGLMLSRSLAEIYQAIRSFYVLDHEGEVFGTVSLQVWWLDLAEVRSLVVADSLAGQGYGRKLVQSCLTEAQELGLSRVFALTYQEEFFARLGFSVIEKNELPHKIWGDCMQCPKFPDCDEIAMTISVGKG